MCCVGEHVHGLDVEDVVVVGEDGEVAGLGGGVAAHIYHPLRGAGQEDAGDVGMDAGTRRVEHHDVGLSVFRDKRSVQHIFHVAGKEFRIVDAVYGRVDLGVGDGFGHILDAHDFACQRREEQRNRSRASVEVINHGLIRIYTGRNAFPYEIAHHGIKPVRLRRVGLVERLGTDLETEAFHLFIYGFGAVVQEAGQVAEIVVSLGIDDIIQRGYLRETGLDRFQQRLTDRPSRFTLRLAAETEHEHVLAGGSGAYDHRTQETPVLAQIVETQSMVDGVLLDEQADGIGRFALQMAFPDVQHLVEEAADMESQSKPLRVGQRAEILAREEPATIGKGVFQFVAVMVGLF